MRLTRETVIDSWHAEEFWKVYQDAFEPLETVSSLRQAMEHGLFIEEMASEDVIKFVLWDGEDQPAAIVCLTNEPSRAPWLNAAYYQKLFPEQAREKAIYFFGSLLVHPDRQGHGEVKRLLQAAVVEVVSHGGIAAYDCCRHNVEVTKLPDIIAAIGGEICNFDWLEVDYQKFYAFVSHGFREGIEVSGN